VRIFPENLTWRTSSWSQMSDCVEVADSKTVILVRDTKNRSRVMLSFPHTTWENFINAVQTDSIILR
jgi:hypothetical protein